VLPAEIAVSAPLAEPIVPMEVVLLLQSPPPVLLAYVTIAPLHTTIGPAIAPVDEGKGYIVTTIAVTQLAPKE
jgi:hypothetical protein